MKQTAIVCAYLNNPNPEYGEPDLQATLDDAARSAGKGCKVFALEDWDRTGPGMNRDRGIMAATDSDVIVVIDAHMRFQADAIARMAAECRKTGGLIGCFCHHSDQPYSFDGNLYAGARMVWRNKVDKVFLPLVAQWFNTATVKGKIKGGKRTAVMGACYAFPREWYIRAGQPLAILNGWGCDEESLSIAAWLSKMPITCIDVHVAHKYRHWGRQHPYCIFQNHAALLETYCADVQDLGDLYAWMRKSEVPNTLNFPAGVRSCGAVNQSQIARCRNAMAKMPRTWGEWKSKACDPEVIDGGAGNSATVPITPATPIVCTTPILLKIRANYGANENNRSCQSCGSFASDVIGTRQTGRLTIRYRKCLSCGQNRTTQEIITTA